MDLTPRQLSSLNEMGIPVWELRTEKSEAIAPEANEQLSQSNCWVMIESEHLDSPTQRLIQAMLFSIGLGAEQFSIITSEQLPQLQTSAMQQTALLVFGEEFAQSLLGVSVARGQIHQPFENSLSTIVSFTLDELLAIPENKALAWQDLQLAKQIINAV